MKAKGFCAQSGLTLIELLIAMVMSSAVLTGVFYIWNYINHYVEESKIKTELNRDVNRIGNQISSQIRRTPSVIDWNESRIEMLNPNGNDTLVYYFDQQNLLANGTPVVVVTPGAKIITFKLTDLNEGMDAATKSVLLDLTLTAEVRDRDTATVHYSIQLPGKEENTPGAEKNNWGF